MTKFSLSLAIMGGVILAALPYPWGWWQPNWLLWIVLYCGLYRQSQLGLWGAWSVGLLADMLGDGLLGTQAGLFVCYMWLLQANQARIGLYRQWQHALMAVLMMCLTRVAIVLGHNALHSMNGWPDFWLPVLINALLWGIVMALAHRAERPRFLPFR